MTDVPQTADEIKHRAPPQRGQGFPNFQTVGAYDGLYPRRREAHGLHHRSQIRMRGENQLGVPPRRAQRRRGEAPFCALASGEDEFTRSHGHAMQVRGVVQAEQPAFHAAAGSEFGEHRRQVAAGALHSAGGFQLRKEADNHAQSLPSAAAEGKLRIGGEDSG